MANVMMTYCFPEQKCPTSPLNPVLNSTGSCSMSIPASGAKEEVQDRRKDWGVGMQKEGWPRQERWQTEAHSRNIHSCCSTIKAKAVLAMDSLLQSASPKLKQHTLETPLLSI